MARVLLIAYSTYICDARVKRHAEALVARGDTVDVICLAPDQAAEFNGVNLIALPVPRFRGSLKSGYLRAYLGFFIRASLIAAKLNSRKRYDAVIVCTMPDAAVVTALIPKLLGSRVLLDIHDTMPELYLEKFRGRGGSLGARLLRIEERASAALANHVLAVHEPHAERLAQAGIPRSKITVVVNSPDPALFPLQGAQRRDADSFTLICHGTLTRRLGLDIAIEAMQMLQHRLPALRLLIIGHGDYKQPAEALAARLGLESRVIFNDRIPVERLRPVLSQASAGLVPNLPSSATHLMLPAKLLEYAMSGLPIITARLRTIEHYFPNDAVRYFEPGNPASLAEGIEELYFDRHLSNSLATRASEVMAQLSWEQQRSQLFHAIDSLLDR
ncbi:MAG TPA: glycosyltransferase family 4 protein [Candidatus Binataceae bacterium]|nr:glycosyltransferase family 4 protein [Candidatus Binataceae bacterium]